MVQAGQVNKGPGVGKIASHCEARDFIAVRTGMPLLGQLNLSEEELQQIERLQEKRSARLALLDHLVKICHQSLLSNAEVMQSIFEQYDFTANAIDQITLGWMPADSDSLANHLMESGHSKENLLSSGAFQFDKFGNVSSRFSERVIFPVIQNGSVMDLYGRDLNWSPGSPKNAPKYLRLPRSKSDPLHQERLAMFGEDALRAKSKQIVLAEGVPDAIAATQAGFPAVAITTNPGAANLKFIAQRLGKTKTAVFVPDQEISEVGIRAALAMSGRLEELGCKCRIGLLPNGSKQEEALNQLSEIVGEDQFKDLQGARESDWNQAIERGHGNAPEIQLLAKELRGKTKIDLCEWMKTVGSEHELHELIRKAQDRLSVEIDRLQTVTDEMGKEEVVESIIEQISETPSAARERHLKHLKSASGSNWAH